jgi:hypothetical protein
MARIAYLGACHWRHADWLGRFYPEDLPEGWDWAFYATQFSCVWLETEQWRALDDAAMADMAQACPDDFVILLRDDGVSPAQLARLVEAARGRARATRADDACILRFDASTDFADFSRAVTLAARQPPVYLLSTDADLTRLEQVSTLLELLGY